MRADSTGSGACTSGSIARPRDATSKGWGGAITTGTAVARILHLAAAPTFAIMALLTAVAGGPTDMPCSTIHVASPLTGMVAMYVLMSIFHSQPWLKLISSWRTRRASGGSY